MDVPSLPDGPLRLLVVSASVAIVCFIASTIVALARHSKRDAGWAALPLALVTAAIVSSRHSAAVHLFSSILLVAVVGRNVVRLTRWPRWLQLVGGLTYFISMVVARRLFG